MSLEEAIQRWRDVKSDLALARKARDAAADALQQAQGLLAGAEGDVLRMRRVLDEAIEAAGLSTEQVARSAQACRLDRGTGAEHDRRATGGAMTRGEMIEQLERIAETAASHHAPEINARHIRKLAEIVAEMAKIMATVEGTMRGSP